MALYGRLHCWLFSGAFVSYLLMPFCARGSFYPIARTSLSSPQAQTVLQCFHIHFNKHSTLVDEVEFIKANLTYVHICLCGWKMDSCFSLESVPYKNGHFFPEEKPDLKSSDTMGSSVDLTFCGQINILNLKV